MTRPLVSLISPVFQSAPYLDTYLDCVRDQTWRPLELIMADDGSSDQSVAIIRDRIPELQAAGVDAELLQTDHQGQAGAVNAALKHVAGKYLTWCDPDDYMLPECIEKKAEYLESHPDVRMVRNDGLVINGDTGEILAHSARREDMHTQNVFDALLSETTYCYAGCYMIDMELFDTCYPDREIPLSPEGQNLQLLLPPASRTECGFVPDVLHHYLRRASGHSSRKRSYTQVRERILNFLTLTRRILPYCSCDQEEYMRKIEEIKDRRMEQLKYSAVLRAKEAFKK